MADEIQIGDRVQALFVPGIPALHGENGTVIDIDELPKPLRATVGRYTVEFESRRIIAYVMDLRPIGKPSRFRRFLNWVSA